MSIYYPGSSARPARSGRFVSQLTKSTMALIMAGGRGERLRQLTEHRAKPATPFGGKYRIIDFSLSNCVNSGIRQILVLTQYKSHSLIQHVQRGWGYLRGELGEFVQLVPAQQKLGELWYRGTADSVYQNLDIIEAHAPELVLVLAGDHVYKMDYGPDDRLPRGALGRHHHRHGPGAAQHGPRVRHRHGGRRAAHRRLQREAPQSRSPCPAAATWRSRRWASTSSAASTCARC